MNQAELKKLLDELREMPNETEWVEFKRAETTFEFDKLGQYFSALSNEANLKGMECGWLVLGIDDKTHDIVGTQWKSQGSSLDKLKSEISQHVTDRITFNEIHELYDLKGRVIMFQIPAAPGGIPIAWKGFWYGRMGESLGALGPVKYEQIRRQIQMEDWSAQIVEGATISALDTNAINEARTQYKEKNPRFIDEVDNWDDFTFLNKAKITIEGKITNTTIILLGTDESDHFLSPSLSKITWVLKDEKNTELDYHHFGPPFLLNVENVFSKIRNIKYRYIPDATLFPLEIDKYDPWVIREALHNCIAHQDYRLRGRINVVETPDELTFTNLGGFIPVSVENVISQDAPPSIYRNHFLAQAMVNLNMIDTVGGGIKKMFQIHRNRYFPLPDYDLSQPEEVRVKIPGKVIDENYTRLLLKRTELDLGTVRLLDKVQKKIRLTKAEHKVLKSKKLVEGRYPKIFLSSEMSNLAAEKAQYIKHRGFDKKYYQNLIILFLKKYGSATRKDIDNLLMDKLPDVLTEVQKKNRIKNLIHEMSRKLNVIENLGSDRSPTWVLTSR